MIDDYIEMPSEIEPIMDNWLRWAKDHAKSPAKCRSLESRWKSPQVWQGMQPRSEVDLFEAIAVEKIICQLPAKHKSAIRCWHILHMPPHIMRRKLGERDIRQLMNQSWQMIYNNLQKLKKCDILQPENIETVHDENAAIRRRA